MRTIIAGCRDFTSQEFIKIIDDAVKESKFHINEVLSGCATGIDTLAIQWARMNGIPINKFPALWKADGRYDPYAGHKRNEEMAKNADALIAVWDGVSRGTKDMIRRAENHKLEIYIKWYKREVVEVNKEAA